MRACCARQAKGSACTHQGPPVSHTEPTEGEFCPSTFTWLWVGTGKRLKPWCFQTLNSIDLFDQNAQVGVRFMQKFQ